MEKGRNSSFLGLTMKPQGLGFPFGTRALKGGSIRPRTRGRTSGARPASSALSRPAQPPRSTRLRMQPVQAPPGPLSLDLKTRTVGPASVGLESAQPVCGGGAKAKVSGVIKTEGHRPRGEPLRRDRPRKKVMSGKLVVRTAETTQHPSFMH